jgi:hypothetical protein
MLIEFLCRCGVKKEFSSIKEMNKEYDKHNTIYCYAKYKEVK